jgi:hypothetical protein
MPRGLGRPSSHFFALDWLPGLTCFSNPGFDLPSLSPTHPGLMDD